MSENSLTNSAIQPSSRNYSWRMLIGLPAWVFTGFALAQLVIFGVVWGLKQLGLLALLGDDTVAQTVVAALVYVLSLVFVIGAPWLLRHRRTTKRDLGLARLPSWMDIVLSPAGFIIYLVLSASLVAIFSSLIPGFNVDQTQTTGFQNISQQGDLLLAFLTLVVVAPLAEESLFRGYLYGKLKHYVPFWAAMLATSILFGALHGQWNVAIDTFALSMVMCSLRETTGSIWAGVLLHMMKNSVAFYFLFINPSLLHTLGG